MSQQWTPASEPAASANIPNYLIPAILATIFCCVPVGIVSIVFATQVNGKIATGDIAGAAQASRKAKMFLFVTIGAGILIWVIAIITWILLFGMAAMSSR